MIAIVVTFFASLALAPLPASRPGGTSFDHSDYDAVLRATVREEKVDYVAIRDRYKPQLRAYLERIASLDPQTLSRDEQLALLINLYNATMLDAIVERYTPWYTVTEKKSAIFSEPLVRLNGQTITLDHLEHELIRKGFKDPRVHAALVCGGLSCPPLQARAFRGDDLNETLDRCVIEWLNNPRHNRVDDAAKRLTLSKIFLWYADDFGGKEKLAAFVSRYLKRDVSGYEVSFFQYDFRLNDTSTAARPDAR